MKIDPRADRLVARYAAGRKGIFERQRALDYGVPERTLDRRLANGEYEFLWPGIYALRGTPASWERAALAAVTYSSPIAALSHGAAARRLGLSGFDKAPVELTTTRDVRLEGVDAHTRCRLDRREVITRGGIPVTTADRTLLDLSSRVDAERLEALVDNAHRNGLTTPDRLISYLEGELRLPRRRKSQLLDILGVRGDVVAAASELETLVAILLRDPSLPPTTRQFQIVAAGRRIARPDFSYPEVKMAVEAHSFRFHHTRGEWERDRRRHRDMESVGWYIMYVTYDDCTSSRRSTVARVRSVLEERYRLFGLPPWTLNCGVTVSEGL